MYVLVLEPITDKILGPLKTLKNRPEDRRFRFRRLCIAWLVLLSISAITTYTEETQKGPNFYQTMGCDRVAPKRVLRKAHRRLSLQLHPDKNPNDPTATKRFRAMSFAYKVLSDKRRKARYELLGLEGVIDARQSKKPVSDSSKLGNILGYYIVGAIFTYFFTLGKHLGRARGWIYCAKAMMAAVEVSMYFEDAILPPTWPLIRWLPLHEQISIMRSFVLGAEYAFFAISRHLFAEDMRSEDRRAEKRLRAVTQSLGVFSQMRKICLVVSDATGGSERRALRRTCCSTKTLANASIDHMRNAARCLALDDVEGALICHAANMEHKHKSGTPPSPADFAAFADTLLHPLNKSREYPVSEQQHAESGVKQAMRLLSFALLAATTPGENAMADDVRHDWEKARRRGDKVPNIAYVDPMKHNKLADGTYAAWPVAQYEAKLRQLVEESQVLNLVTFYEVQRQQMKAAKAQERQQAAQAGKFNGGTNIISSFFSMVMMGYAMQFMFGPSEEYEPPSVEDYA